MDQKIRFPISLKLILIFSLLIIVVLGISTYMVATMVRSDEQVKAEENNHTINGRTAVVIQDTFDYVERNAIVLLDSLDVLQKQEKKSVSVDTDSLFDSYFLQNPSLLFLYKKTTGLKTTPSFLSKNEDATKITNDWILSQGDVLQEVVSTQKTSVLNISSLYGVSVLCVLFPYNETECVIVGFSGDSLLDTMSSGTFNTSFLLNSDGDVLVHSDYKKMLDCENLNDLSVVSYARDFSFKDGHYSLDNGQILMPNENGENYFYAFHRLKFAELYVFSCESEALVFEAINKTTYRSILVSGAIFFLAIMIIWFFSTGISHPLKNLVSASHKIENGDFLLEIKAKTHDEVGVLTKSFVQMGKGLAERERLKTTFSKFTNKAIAERALKGELALGGEKRNATIFFSDIRSFTAISEKLQPEEVVEFLNEYMTRMVACVNKTSGVVDKYIGDAIMAVWGAPDSSGSPETDAWNCVRAALMMRRALLAFNEGRGGDKKPILKIGCGINSGDVLAGQIGSSERMEYTVIGDAVNFASRTESLNKPLGTDILITENTWLLVREKIISQEMPAVQVKGKEKPVRMFAVVNAVGAPGPQTLQQVRDLLHIPTPDLGNVDVNAEEKKYKIGS